MSLAAASFLGSAVLAAGLTWLLIGWAKQRKLFLPAVRERDLHTKPVPRVGGIAVVLTFLIVTLGVAVTEPTALAFTQTTSWGLDRNLFGLILALMLLAVVNVRDDLKSISWQLRLATQVSAALIVVWFGIRVDWLTNPFGANWVLGGFSGLFVVVWLVGLSNVTNWLDGVNGLAGGVGAIALAVLYFLSVSPAVGQTENALLAAIACGALVGFLPFNIIRAKAFLGDTGSMFIGFLVGVLAIISGGKVATAFLVLAIPFLDAIIVFGSRLFNHQSPFLADKRHLHHRLLEVGMKPWQIVGIFYAISLLFGLVALNTQTLGKVQAAAAALILMVALVLLYSYGGHRAKKQNEKR